MSLLPIVNPEVDADLARVVRATYRSSPYPWSRLLAAPGRNPANLRVRFVSGIPFSGYFFPIGEIQLNAEHFAGDDGGYTFLHECGHLVDYWTLTGEDRDELRASVGASRWWGSPDPGFLDVPAESFATVFARAFRPPHWPTPGPLAPGLYPFDEDLVRTVCLRRTLMPFTDIAELGAESQAAITRIADLGISRGTSETTFSPHDLVTREQMALFLDRLLGVME